MLILKIVLVFCIFYGDNLFSFGVKKKSDLNNSFQVKLKKINVYEPKVHLLLFDDRIILIGAISNYSNLDNVLLVAKKISLLIKKPKKPYNLLIYKLAPKNIKVKNIVERSLAKNRFRVGNYMIFTMGHFVWVIGYARNCYEKEKVKEILSLLKARKKIEDFYCFITFKKNCSKGFIYRHIV